MKNDIVIATACSRLENLQTIHDSIRKSASDFSIENFTWLVVLDRSLEISPEEVRDAYLFMEDADIVLSTGSKSIGGYVHKNLAISICREKYPNSWIHFLDDDTICHPNFFSLTGILDDRYIFAVFHQSFNDTYLRHLAGFSDIRPTRIDMGQYVLNLKKLPSDFFFDENVYMSDGIEIGKLYDKVGNENVQVVGMILSYFNFLNPPHWLPPSFETDRPIPIGMFFE